MSSKAKIVTILLLVLFMDMATYTAEFRNRKLDEYVSKVETLSVQVEDARREIQEQEAVYKAQLMDIVSELYSKDGHRTGGYETPEGADVDAVYEAIMNRAMDYDALLSNVTLYFDERKEYLEDIPSVWPVEYDPFTRITSAYGWRMSPISGKIGFHPGLDIAGVWNAKVIATASGVVRESWPPPDGYYSGHPELGGMLMIEHDSGYSTVYGHLKEKMVKEGDRVEKGDVVGIMGDTGKSRGIHLHYEVHKNGVLVNPLDYLGL